VGAGTLNGMGYVLRFATSNPRTRLTTKLGFDAFDHMIRLRRLNGTLNRKIKKTSSDSIIVLKPFV